MIKIYLAPASGRGLVFIMIMKLINTDDHTEGAQLLHVVDVVKETESNGYLIVESDEYVNYNRTPLVLYHKDLKLHAWYKGQTYAVQSDDQVYNEDTSELLEALGKCDINELRHLSDIVTNGR